MITRADLDALSLPSTRSGGATYRYLLIDMDKGRLIIPDYQRGRVWTPEQSARFMGYVLTGGQPPPIWVQEHPNEDVEEVIDGLQRLTAFRAFMDGEVPAELPDGRRIFIGDLAPDPKDDTKTVATWNDDVFGTFVLPGVDGGAAPVFAGGSNIAISAASKNQSASRELMKIIFSADYQKMLGQNGLGPANLDYADSLGDDQFAKALVASAADSKLTPAAPGWAAVEGSGLLEEFFGKVNGGGDIKALAAEYDTKIDALING